MILTPRVRLTKVAAVPLDPDAAKNVPESSEGAALIDTGNQKLGLYSWLVLLVTPRYLVVL